jgi:hypothetical protein
MQCDLNKLAALKSAADVPMKAMTWAKSRRSSMTEAPVRQAIKPKAGQNTMGVCWVFFWLLASVFATSNNDIVDFTIASESCKHVYYTRSKQLSLRASTKYITNKSHVFH